LEIIKRFFNNNNNNNDKIKVKSPKILLIEIKFHKLIYLKKKKILIIKLIIYILTFLTNINNNIIIIF